MSRVLSTKEFDTFEKLLGGQYQKEISKIIEQLKKDPLVGKPLGYPFLREKKFGGYRLYYLFVEDKDTVLLLTISDKKSQQKTINELKEDLDSHFKSIRGNI